MVEELPSMYETLDLIPRVKIVMIIIEVRTH